MATYTNLSRGSKGDDVIKLQQSLVNAGYNVGSSGVDGSYGPQTEAAVRKYQTDNNLKIDGIAGSETLSSLYGANTSAAKTQQSISTPSVTAQSGSATSKVTDDLAYQAATQALEQAQGNKPTLDNYSSATSKVTDDPAYQAAMQALEQAQGNKPTLEGKYDEQLADIYNQIMNREDFSYDINEDALYEQYKNQYITQGKLAMQDAMGQAAAMTGGYGNSYADMVGNQTFQAYMQQLNAVMPELYGQAYERYLQEEQRLYDQYAMLAEMSDDEFSRYQAQLDEYWKGVDLAQTQKDDAYNIWRDTKDDDFDTYQLALDEYWRGVDLAQTQKSDAYDEWLNAIQFDTEAEEREYQRQQDNYDRFVSLITSTGYIPSAEELAAAGMSSGEANAYANYYKKQEAESAASAASSSAADAEAEAEEKLVKIRQNEIKYEDEVREKCEEYKEAGDNTGLEAYLTKRVEAEYMTEDTAYALYEEFRSSSPMPDERTSNANGVIQKIYGSTLPSVTR